MPKRPSKTVKKTTRRNKQKHPRRKKLALLDRKRPVGRPPVPKDESMGVDNVVKTPISLSPRMYRELREGWVRHNKLSGQETKFTVFLRTVLLNHMRGDALPVVNATTAAEKKRLAA